MITMEKALEAPFADSLDSDFSTAFDELTSGSSFGGFDSGFNAGQPQSSSGRFVALQDSLFDSGVSAGTGGAEFDRAAATPMTPAMMRPSPAAIRVKGRGVSSI